MYIYIQTSLGRARGTRVPTAGWLFKWQRRHRSFVGGGFVVKGLWGGIVAEGNVRVMYIIHVYARYVTRDIR